nr:actin-like protein 6B [Onthophagus taurus]
MSGGVYGGDEIGALVLDVGSNTIRAGYAGEDSPRFDIPTTVGIWRDSVNEYKTRYNIGTVSLHVTRPEMEMGTFLREGMVENWDMYENVVNYVYYKLLQTEPHNHPILISEPAWNIQQKREQMTELMFEKYKVPALYLAKSPSLVAFANGRSTCLVVDSGATHTSAVPVYDGHIISQAMVKSPAGGDYLTAQCKVYLEGKNIDIVPASMVASKEITRPDEIPNWKSRNLPRMTTSWHNYMTKEVMQDFQASVLHISDSTYDEEIVKTMPAIHYEFPNGYHKDFGVERFKITEPLFNLTARNGCGIQPTLDVSTLVTTSVGMCEIDHRPTMYSSVVVTGGNSNIQGFTDRLNRDLQSKVPPSMRLKIISQAGMSEKRFASWLGGSILSSLGTFTQLWVSKQEYEEVGKGVVRNRGC